MLPDMGGMKEGIAAFIQLIERGVIALESINRHLFTIADIETGRDARERDPRHDDPSARQS